MEDYIVTIFAQSQEASMVIKYFLVILTLTFIGCASISARPYACANGNSNSADKVINIIVGNIFQFGDCALSSSLRIETGEYYRVKMPLINNSIWKQGGIPQNPPPEEIKKFARAFNCKENVDAEFNKELIVNQDSIFGEKWTKSEREVTLKIESIISLNELLNKSCTKYISLK